MTNKQKKGLLSSYLKTFLSCVIIILILALVMICALKPRIFVFHAVILSDQNVSGKVFESSDGIFFVRLDSGSQMTVRQNPPKVFLLKTSKTSGFCIGHFLVLPASSIGGVDLSQSESFGRQVPNIKDGMITLKDPMNQNGTFSFPLKR